MIIESDVKMQDMLRELFKKNGYRVLVMSDPDRALDRDSAKSKPLVTYPQFYYSTKAMAIGMIRHR
jgi:hypothetical protein